MININKNYITIQGWMVVDLKLKGNELFVYAVIFGFSQDENTRFTGSLKYLATWTNATKQGVSKNLKSLLEKSYISKEETYQNGIKFVSYYATKFNGGMQQSCIGGMQQSLPNSIDTNKIEDNTIDIPDFIDVDLWNGFVEMRKKLKKPLTKIAIDLNLKSLSAYEADKGGDANLALENSIKSSWQGVFKPNAKRLYPSSEKGSSIKDLYSELSKNW